MPEDDEGYNNVAMFIDCFSKKAISLLYYKTTTAKDLADLYYTYCFRYLRLLDFIVSDRGL